MDDNVEAKLIKADEPNANGTIYPKETLETVAEKHPESVEFKHNVLVGKKSLKSRIYKFFLKPKKKYKNYLKNMKMRREDPGIRAIRNGKPVSFWKDQN